MNIDTNSATATNANTTDYGSYDNDYNTNSISSQGFLLFPQKDKDIFVKFHKINEANNSSCIWKPTKKGQGRMLHGHTMTKA